MFVKKFYPLCNMKKILLLALLFLQASCVTKALWGDKQYQEKINQIFVGTDGRYVVFVSDQYHYIFTDNSDVLRTLLSLSKNVIAIDKKETYLKLSSSNDLKGTLVIKGSTASLTIDDIYLLRKAGIYPDRNGELFVRVNVSGRRYGAKYLSQSAPGATNPQMVTI